METSAWEDLKETLVAAGLVGMRGRGELIVFLSFGVGPVGMRKGTQESFLNLLVVWESQRRDKVQPIRTKKEENKEAKQEGPKEVSRAAKKRQQRLTWVGHMYCKRE